MIPFRPGPIVCRFNKKTITSDATQELDVVVPAGKWWRILGFQIAVDDASKAVADALGICLVLNERNQASGDEGLTFATVWSVTGDWPSEFQNDLQEKYFDSAFCVKEGAILRAIVTIDTFTANTDMRFGVIVEEYDLPDTGSEQF